MTGRRNRKMESFIEFRNEMPKYRFRAEKSVFVFLYRTKENCFFFVFNFCLQLNDLEVQVSSLNSIVLGSNPQNGA